MFCLTREKPIASYLAPGLAPVAACGATGAMRTMELSGPGSTTRASGSQPIVLQQALLACGIFASPLYVAMNVFVPMQWEGYKLRIADDQRTVGD